MTSPLTVRGLRITARRPLLGPVDLTVAAGERVGLVGRSGVGKSLTAAAVLGVLPPGLRTSGRVDTEGLVGALPQDAASALNPLVRVGPQLGLPLAGMPRRERAHRVAAVAERLGLGGDQLAAWPLDLSGGQRQRAALTLALVRSPALLVADEPTSALDAVTQEALLVTLREAVVADGTALLMISHDLALVARLCTRVLVMASGTIVETGPVAQILTAPEHPETRRLVEAAAVLGVGT